MKQLWVSDEAFEYVRKLAFESRQTLGKTATNAILNGVEQK